MKLKLVVMDVAGTMLEPNSFVQRALVRVLENFGIKVTEQEVDQLVGLDTWFVIRQLIDLRNKQSIRISDSWIREIQKRFEIEMIQFYATSREVIVRTGVRDVVRILKSEGVKIALDSDLDRKIIQTLIHRFEWDKDELIDFVVTSDEVVNGRPFADMIFRAMELAGVQRVEKVAKIGGTPYDIRQGVNAGCRLVAGVPTGAFSLEQLATARPTHLLQELSQFMNILQPVQV